MDKIQRTSFVNNFKNFWSYHWRGVLRLAIIIYFLYELAPLNEMDGSLPEVKILRCLYLYYLMGICWITNVIPIYVTAFLPIFALSMWRIIHANVVVAFYFNNVIAMFIGAETMKLAIEYCNLHKRIALRIITFAKNKPIRILWTLIFISSFMSFWLSNTSTTIVMCSIVDEIVDDLDELGIIDAFEETDDGKPKASRVASGFYLSVTYAATIGGAGTLLGTGTNMALKALHDLRYPRSINNVNLLTFSMYTIPMVLLFTIFLCIWMQKIFLRKIDVKNANNEIIDDQMYNVRSSYNALSRISFHEIQIAMLFLIMIILWAVQSYIVGWYFREEESNIEVSTVIIGVTLLLFLLPKNYNFTRVFYGSEPLETKEAGPLLNYAYAIRNIPYGFIFIVGGGCALLDAIKLSGMGEYLADKFQPLSDLPLWSLQLFFIIIAVVFALFIPSVIFCILSYPILCEVAVACEIHPLYLIFPATIASEYSFLLPIGSPGLEHVKAYEYVPQKYMLLGGIGPTIMAILLLFLNGQTYHSLIFQV